MITISIPLALYILSVVMFILGGIIVVKDEGDGLLLNIGVLMVAAGFMSWHLIIMGWAI